MQEDRRVELQRAAHFTQRSEEHQQVVFLVSWVWDQYEVMKIQTSLTLEVVLRLQQNKGQKKGLQILCRICLSILGTSGMMGSSPVPWETRSETETDSVTVHWRVLSGAALVGGVNAECRVGQKGSWAALQ